MWPFGKNRKAFSRERAIPAVVRARFDAAQTTAENAKHWAMADAMSADGAGSADVRRKLRQRSRYEVANNSYAKGIVLTIANDCIGTGPRLQLLADDGQINRQVEMAFAEWSEAVNLAEKLRTMRMAKSTDGETFAVLTANPMIDSPVKLDVQLVEADRVASPLMALLPVANDVDGITLDAWGNPQTYTILRQHPGDLTAWKTHYDLVPADAVVHWFRSDRPGQHRGIPEITPALPLFAQLRRYTLAVIAAAETAADFAAVLFTDAPANGEAQALEPMTVSSYGYIEAVYSSEITCESSGLLTIDGYLLVADDGSCRVQGPMVLSRSSGFDAYYWGYLSVEPGGTVDAFGYVSIHYDALLYVNGGEMRVYKDIYISGQMYGGGKILMLRREGQIRDGDGNSLFKLDQAYGHGQQPIA